jgi:hypothetical protein
MRRRIVVLLAMVVMAVAMLAASAPAFTQELGPGACDPNPGNTEANRAPQTTPPGVAPGTSRRSNTANLHDPQGHGTGRSELQEQCQ